MVCKYVQVCNTDAPSPTSNMCVLPSAGKSILKNKIVKFFPFFFYNLNCIFDSIIILLRVNKFTRFFKSFSGKTKMGRVTVFVYFFVCFSLLFSVRLENMFVSL